MKTGFEKGFFEHNPRPDYSENLKRELPYFCVNGKRILYLPQRVKNSFCLAQWNGVRDGFSGALFVGVDAIEYHDCREYSSFTSLTMRGRKFKCFET